MQMFVLVEEDNLRQTIGVFFQTFPASVDGAQDQIQVNAFCKQMKLVFIIIAVNHSHNFQCINVVAHSNYCHLS